MPARRLLLCEYLVARDRAIVFGVRSDWNQPKVVNLDLDHRQLSSFTRTNFGSRQRVRDLVEMDLEELWHGYDYLIAPLSRWSDPEDVVYLVPHESLHYLPLHALRLEGQYLIKRNPVAYLPSAATLQYCYANRNESNDNRRRAAIFGDSRNNLPASRAEAETIAEMFDVMPILGDDVTRDAFQESAIGADIIHFAGHAEFHQSDALQSGLQLANNDVLTASDIFHLPDFRAELVALSGCQTGVNERRPGDELIGLTRAFLYARACSLLVSLWNVVDESAAFLMQRFYTYLLNPDTAKVDALRSATLDTMTHPKWESIYHWAPLVLVGDWR